MANNKIKAKVKVKPVKATLGKGSGGLLSARIVTEVKKKQNG